MTMSHQTVKLPPLGGKLKNGAIYITSRWNGQDIIVLGIHRHNISTWIYSDQTGGCYDAHQHGRDINAAVIDFNFR